MLTKNIILLVETQTNKVFIFTICTTIATTNICTIGKSAC
jgi:hypothetical protein